MTDAYNLLKTRLLTQPLPPASDDKEDDTAETLLLVREYLRRVALWIDATKDDSEWAFGRMIGTVVPGLDTEADEEEVQNDAEQIRERYSARIWMRRSIYNALLWAKYEDRIPTELRRLGLPHPYEPLFAVIQNGGFFYLEHGWVQFTSAGIAIGSPERWLKGRRT